MWSAIIECGKASKVGAYNFLAMYTERFNEGETG